MNNPVMVRVVIDWHEALRAIEQHISEGRGVDFCWSDEQRLRLAADSLHSMRENEPDRRFHVNNAQQGQEATPAPQKSEGSGSTPSTQASDQRSKRHTGFPRSD